jgi:isoamylase
MFNAYWEALDFDLPPAPISAAAGWRRWIDTSRESPEDIIDIGAAPLVSASQYRVASRSVAAIFRKPAGPGTTFEVAEGDVENSA